MSSTNKHTETEFPLLPLRDVVVYPHMVLPLFVGRKKSIQALESAMGTSKQVLLVAQRDANDDNPAQNSLHEIGTVASILQLLKLPDGTVKVLVEGAYRAKILSFTEVDGYFRADVVGVQTPGMSQDEAKVLISTVKHQFEQYVELSKKVPSEVMTSLSGIDEPGRLADTIAAHMSLPLSQKQEALEIADERQRLEHLLSLMDAEIDVHRVEKKIRGRVKKQMEKSQREYYLNEQMKAIQKELVYCLVREFLGSVRICIRASSSNSSSVAIMGRRPTNSGINP